MASAFSSLPTVLTTIARNPLRQDLVGRLLVAICRRELPGGERLVEEEVAERFGVSRTPVREALGELAMFGMVENRPGRGAIVRPFGRQQLLEIYEVRAVLEAEAARLTSAAPTRASKKECFVELLAAQRELAATKRHDRAWSERAVREDERFHDGLCATCGNGRLADEIGRYGRLVHAVRAAIGNPAGAQEAAVHEHITVAERILKGDGSGAGAAMRNHVESAAVYAADALFKE